MSKEKVNCVDFPHLYKLLVLEQHVEKYEEEFRNELAVEKFEKNRLNIINKLPKLIELSVTIWCRSADICDHATHCVKLNCKFKNNDNENVVEGCSRCGSFVVTTKSEVWECAKHLTDRGSIDLI